jgi:YidC/Oxa1 family membrane protein insertase
MEKRLVLFFVISFGILMAYQGLMAWLYPPPPRPAAQQAAEAEPGAPADQQAQAQPAAEQPAAPQSAAEQPAAAVADADQPDPAQPPEAAISPALPVQRVTLGSADPQSPYAMLVTLVNAGAAVERIELNHLRHTDQEDRSGYLGHLAAVDAGEGTGALLGVVGPGTPAAQAGLQAGDVVTHFAEQPIADAEALEKAVGASRPRQQVQVEYRRGDAVHTTTVALRRRPMEVIRPSDLEQLIKNWEPVSPDVIAPPEWNVPAFRFTLEQLGDRKLSERAGELRGVDLQSGVWEIVPGATDAKVEFRRQLSRYGLEVLKRFELASVQPGESGPAYHLNVTVELRNTGPAETKLAYRLYGPEGLPTEGWWYASKISRNWGGAGPRDVIVGALENGSVSPGIITAATIAGEEEPQPRRGTKLAFIGVDAQYFASVMMPQTDSARDSWFYEWQPVVLGPIPPGDKKRLANVSFRLTSETQSLAPGATLSHTYKVFAGPKDPNLVSQYGLGALIYYGWFGWVAAPMSKLLHAFYFIVRNYGLAIILLTVLVRSAMMPLSRKQVQSAQKMQELQPELKKLQDKYKNDLEARSRAQRELFAKHNYNPLGGCLLMFVQLPIFIGLYRALSSDMELRGAPLFWDGAWCSNLAAPDMLFRWAQLLPSFVVNWLGPYFNLFPLITIALFIWQQKMFMPPATDEQTRMQQKMMQYMMIFIGVMFFKVPSGLCLYFIASSLWGLAERKFIPRPGLQPAETPAAAPAARLAAAIAGNGKSSGNGKKKQREKR